MVKRYVKWNCAEEGNVEANARARAYPESLCVSASDYDAWSDENEALRTALQNIRARCEWVAMKSSDLVYINSVATGALAASQSDRGAE